MKPLHHILHVSVCNLTTHDISQGLGVQQFRFKRTVSYKNCIIDLLKVACLPVTFPRNPNVIHHEGVEIRYKINVMLVLVQN
jgi:hypothetical protein